ncbi:MAG: alpha-glucan family phosphorylase [Planctomycetes bacterium]|nr:alpha-glucan family phosphorylase [Planctomycetota bacterium]
MTRTRSEGKRGSDNRYGDRLARIAALARNLRWTWSTETQRLFAALDPVEWEATNHNPLATLARLTPERRETLLTDEAFGTQLQHCEDELHSYLRTRTWFQRAATPAQRRLRVAYFCAEYGLHESFPQYAGGLGVLAGDHLKSASDLGIPLVAVGLLYRCGYYQQELDHAGATRAVYPHHNFRLWPVIDTRCVVHIPLGKLHVKARVWQVHVGRVPLYLLDTDVPANRPRDRAITHVLYGGDSETRIRQELVLGIGGMRALEKLGLRPTVFHLNEGHAAFCVLERLQQLRRGRLSLDRATQRVRASTVFTTHTPVAAGHDRFPPALVRRYLAPYAQTIGLAQGELLALGRAAADQPREQFCMTVLALRHSARCNGVSKLHGQVSREMWAHVTGGARSRAASIGHVTNGIHSQTWLAPEMEALYRSYVKPRWIGAGPGDDWWQRAERIPVAELWRARTLLRKKLVHFLRRRLLEQAQRRVEPAAELAAASEALDENALTIGFARRFATYKRAPLIFRDARRLAALLNDPARPVQLIFAGKAHPRDEAGQQFAARIHALARRPAFRGRVVLVENYDMYVGRVLTAGCDVWLNNPLRPQEASGTSGMKPPLHGGLNCSIPDGWWPEAYNRRNGWTIGDGRTCRSRAAQDRYDAEQLYHLLEDEIVPLFYQRGRDGVPRAWARRMVAALKTVCGQFNTHRMLSEYLSEYYLPAHGG